MNTQVVTAESAINEAVGKKVESTSSLHWKILLLVTINFLSVPLAIPVLYFPQIFSPETWTELWLVLVGLYHGQLFLLAYWMSFGGMPRVGRRIFLSVLTIVGATVVAAMFTHRAYMVFGGDRPIQLADFQPIVISLFVVWSLHLIFLVATCLSPVVIRFPEPSQNLRHKVGQFALLDALALIGVALVPLGLLLLLFWMDQTFAGKMLADVVASALFTGIALTPAALLLVTETNFIAKFMAASGWAALVIVLSLMIPHAWLRSDAAATHAAACAIVFFNLLVLRLMGLRWLVSKGQNRDLLASPSSLAVRGDV